jgi:hypothetical protein
MLSDYRWPNYRLEVLPGEYDGTAFRMSASDTQGTRWGLIGWLGSHIMQDGQIAAQSVCRMVEQMEQQMETMINATD